MSAIVNIEDAPIGVKELVSMLGPGEVVIITQNHKPVARLVSELPAVDSTASTGKAATGKKLRPPPGLGRGIIAVTDEDDEHLKDFAEYMP